ncbi:hypothetical protein MASR1M32_19530 [Rhodobacter sp.]
MGETIYFLCLVLVSCLCGWGAHAAWRRGWRWLPLLALAAVLATALMFWWLSQQATGGMYPGLGQFFIAAVLLIGPGAGLLLGMLVARWERAGIVISAVYGLALMLLFYSI